MKSAEKDVCSVGLWGAAAVVASGSSILERFADALSPSPVAFELKAPVLLTDNNGDYLLKRNECLPRAAPSPRCSLLEVRRCFPGLPKDLCKRLRAGSSVPAGHMDYAAMLETSIGNYHSKYVTLTPFDVTNSSRVAMRRRIPLSRAPTLLKNTVAIKTVTLS